MSPLQGMPENPAKCQAADPCRNGVRNGVRNVGRNGVRNVGRNVGITMAVPVADYGTSYIRNHRYSVINKTLPLQGGPSL